MDLVNQDSIRESLTPEYFKKYYRNKGINKYDLFASIEELGLIIDRVVEKGELRWEEPSNLI